MKSFSDSTGDEWTISINVASVKRARDLAGVDLMTAIDGTLFDAIGQDMIIFADTLAAICKPQIDERSMSPADFGERLADGETIDAALAAFLEDLISFFPPGRREALTKIAGLTKEIEILQIQEVIETAGSPKTIETAKKLIEMEREKAEQRIEERLKTHGNSSGSVPQSSDVTPTPSPSGS